MEAPPDDPLRRALALIAATTRRRLETAGVRELRGRTELRLTLPLAAAELDAAAATLARQVDELVSEHLRHHASVRLDRVFCLRCRSADCEHAAPPGPRQVLAGYGSSGVPRWVDLAQLLLERRDPEVDRLYASPPRLLARVLAEEELARELLPAYRPQGEEPRLRGALIAGWFVPAGEAVAATFAVESLRGRRGRPHLLLTTLVHGAPEMAGGHPGATAPPPWSTAVRATRTELALLERTAPPRPPAAPVPVAAKVAATLESLAASLVRPHRARERRTGHGEQRHRSGERPTGLALADLRRASAEQVLRDARNDTWVVLGERGRAHVFNAAGRLVTSVRYPPETIARRRQRGGWRAVPREDAELLRRIVEERSASGEDG